jgi:hypothetical protein
MNEFNRVPITFHESKALGQSAPSQPPPTPGRCGRKLTSKAAEYLA